MTDVYLLRLGSFQQVDPVTIELCPDTNCTNTCLLGRKSDENGCEVCECSTKGMFESDIIVDSKL